MLEYFDVYGVRVFLRKSKTITEPEADDKLVKIDTLKNAKATLSAYTLGFKTATVWTLFSRTQPAGELRQKRSVQAVLESSVLPDVR